MMKIKWKDLGAKLSRVFTTQKEAETAVAELRRDGIHVEIELPPASVARLKPKSKPRVTGGRGGAIIGTDGREIKIGERCFHRAIAGWNKSARWQRGTLERVQVTAHGTYAWVAGKYRPWRMVDVKNIRAHREVEVPEMLRAAA